MYKKGIILSNKNGKLKIKIISEEATFCDKCTIKGICNQNETERIINLKYRTKLPEGSSVLIKINEGFSIILAFLIFILPLIIFIFSVFIFQKISKGGSPYIMSIFILVFYFMIIAIIQHRLVSFVEILKIENSSNES